MVICSQNAPPDCYSALGRVEQGFLGTSVMRRTVFHFIITEYVLLLMCPSDFPNTVSSLG